MRLPYIQDSDLTSEADKAVLSRIQQRRGSKGLIALDRTLLHSPPVADGWNTFLGAIRTQTSLSPSIRETAISRVAVLNSAWYEWDSHSPLLRAAPGVTQAHVDAVLRSAPRTADAGIQDAAHAAVLAYTDAMTLDVRVPEGVFAELRKHFNEREVVEITSTVAAYNCVSRVLVAMDVGERNAQEGPGERSEE